MQNKQKTNIYLVKKDDPAYFDDGVSPLDQENRWRAYISSYQTFDPTDGVPKESLNIPMLARNVRAVGADPTSLSYPPSPPLQPTDIGGERISGTPGSDPAYRFLAAKTEENLQFRISVNGYKTVFQPKTQEGWSMPERESGADDESVKEARDDALHREDVMRDTYLMNNKGMVGMTKEEVEKANEGFTKLAEATDGSEVIGDGDDSMEIDGE